MKKQNGSALLLTTVLLFVVLAMVTSLSYVTVMEQKMSQKTKSSVGAFYGAESGVEWALNNIANATGDKITDAFSGFNGGKIDCVFGNDVCGIYLLDESGNVISDNPGGNRLLFEVKAVRSVGTQTAGEPTTRAIEAAVAASDVCGFPTEVSPQSSTKKDIAHAAEDCRSRMNCWRLPSDTELVSLLDPDDTSNEYLWVSGGSGTSSNSFLGMKLNTGENANSGFSYNNQNYFRCVR